MQRSKKEHKEEAKVDEEETAEEEAPVPLVTHVNNILHSIFSNVEVYINNQHIYNSDGVYAHKSYISNNFKGAISEYKGVLLCEGYDYEKLPDGIMEAPFFRRRMKLLSRRDGFVLYGNLGVDFSPLLSCYLQIWKLGYDKSEPDLISTWIATTPTSVSELLIVHFTLVVMFTTIIITRNEYTCLLTLLEFNCLEILAKTFKVPARLNQFNKKNTFRNTPVCRIAIAMNTNSASTGSYTENPFWYQQFILRQIKKLRGSQPIVEFDAADKCRLFVTLMKAMIFQEDIRSIPIDNSKDHYVLVFH